MPGERDFSHGVGAKADSSAKIVDSVAGFGRFLAQMALNAPYLPPNPSGLGPLAGRETRG